jgi:lipopolysaccharide transport system permease protein
MSVTRPRPALTDGTPGKGEPAIAADVLVTHIRPKRGWHTLDWRELWEYRELLVLLAWRDVRVRYKQTALGFGWAIGVPVLTMVVFAVVFGGIVNVPSENLPYPIFAYSGLLPWLYFSQAVGRGGTSLVGNSALIGKVYFPRLVVPLASVLTPLVDFAFAAVVLFGLMAWYGIGPTWGAVALPGFLLMSVALALAVVLWLSAVNVKYRDITLGIPVLLQFWMYLSPVIYPVTLVPARLRSILYTLNPMAGVIDGFRWGLLGKASPDPGVVAMSAAVVLVLLLGGLLYFRRTERTLVDIL